MKSVPVITGVAALSLAVYAGMQPPSPAEQIAARAEVAGSPKPVATYAEGVAEILNRRCVSCHRPGEVAPFSLEGYDNAKKWSGMISSVSRRGIMPPWKAVSGYGEFLDENRLTPAEIETLRVWHEAGAPRGEGPEPAPPVFPDGGWSLGTPDLVIGPSKPFELSAEGGDLYRNFVIPLDIKEPVFVKAMEVKPDNSRIVHHVIAFIDNRGQARRLEENNKDGQEGYVGMGGGVGFLPGGSLGGWAPGANARFAPDGVAFRLNPGDTIVMQVHYNRTGKPEKDQTQIGLYYAKEPIQHEMQLNWIFNFLINIPPGRSDYKARQVHTYRQDSTLYAAMPHMHLLGRDMKSWLEFPDGTTRPLIHIDDWDFNWQLTYYFKEPIKVPAGTRQIVEAVYDNSNDNPRNPSNPPRRVTFGEETTDEMFLLIVPYTVDKK
jgi:hypothetical protein